MILGKSQNKSFGLPGIVGSSISTNKHARDENESKKKKKSKKKKSQKKG
jgi:hypothetical protein